MEFRIPSGMGWALALLGGLAAVVLPMSHGAQPEPHQRVSVPYDWSHQSREILDPLKSIKALKVQQEPRYWHQKFRMKPPHGTGDMVSEDRGERASLRFRRKNQLHRDWAFSMSSLAAGTATAGSATTYPANLVLTPMPLRTV